VAPLVADKDRMVRIWAVHSLSTIGGAEVVEPLVRALDDQFFWVRTQAIVALGKLGPALVPTDRLRPLTDDPLPLVAMVAAETLLACGQQEMVPKLEAMLEVPEPHLSSHFALVAQELEIQAAAPILLKLLNHESGQVRASAAEALGRLKAESAYDPLVKLLNDREVAVRASAASALGDLGDARIAQELERLAATGMGPLKLAAISGLGKLGNAAVLVTLRGALNDDDMDIRLAAAVALGYIDHKDVIPLLQNVYNNQDESIAVRVYAAVSAARLGDAGAVSQLNTQAQGSETAHDRVWAAWGLGETGGRSHLFPLVNLLANDDEMVRPVAAAAVLKLTNRLEAEASAGSAAP
jgi:HEAT repeat protein